MAVDAYQTIVIGGGFYGATLALQLARQGRRIALVEKNAQLLAGASYVNQARVHQGYHYPRALLTAQRSHAHYARFQADYDDCIESMSDAYYAVARQGSKVTAQQFRSFCARIEAPLAPAPESIRRLFDPYMIEEVWRVEEAVFNAERLRQRLTQALAEAGVVLYLATEAQRAQLTTRALLLQAKNGQQDLELSTASLYACLYSGTNAFLERSGIAPIGLKQEITEMPLVEMPDILKPLSLTVMCGPFFSFLPFPPRPGLHTLSHVRYTPHAAWLEGPGKTTRTAARTTLASHFPHMVKDAVRYLPLLSAAVQRDSLWETKTVLPISETDDSRPILYLRDYGLPGLTCILGGKIDNVYDMTREVELG